MKMNKKRQHTLASCFIVKYLRWYVEESSVVVFKISIILFIVMIKIKLNLSKELVVQRDCIKRMN